MPIEHKYQAMRSVCLGREILSGELQPPASQEPLKAAHAIECSEQKDGVKPPSQEPIEKTEGILLHFDGNGSDLIKLCHTALGPGV
jgi:hypothetical protein